VSKPVIAGDSERYVHDCEKCVYLGTTSSDSFHDLYFCEQRIDAEHAMSTVIARYGDDGPHYESGLPFSYGMSAPLTVARLLAEQQGLLKPEQKPLEVAERPAPARRKEQ
jgi:hypothetical protein